MILPQLIEKRPSGVLVERSDIGTQGYHENVEYQLQLTFDSINNRIEIEYYGEDGEMLEDEEILLIIKKYNKLKK